MFNTDCNRLSVIQRPQKRDLDLFCTKLLQHCTAKTIYCYSNDSLLEYCVFYEY